jgi:hypothetical protein
MAWLARGTARQKAHSRANTKAVPQRTPLRPHNKFAAPLLVRPSHLALSAAACSLPPSQQGVAALHLVLKDSHPQRTHPCMHTTNPALLPTRISPTSNQLPPSPLPFAARRGRPPLGG